MSCKNCGFTVDGNFCSNCGQGTKVGKINFKNLLKETSENSIQIERGLFYTFRELFLRPDICITEFLEGKRKKYFKPLTYLLTLSTLYFIISKISGGNTWMNEIVSGFEKAGTDNNTDEKILLILNWFTANFAYATLLLLPLFSLGSYISFKDKGLNYFEHIVLNAYVTGHQAFFYSVFTIIAIFIDYYYLEAFPVFISILYAFWVFWKIFSKGNRIINLFRSILTYLLYSLFIIIIGGFVAFVTKL